MYKEIQIHDPAMTTISIYEFFLPVYFHMINIQLKILNYTLIYFSLCNSLDCPGTHFVDQAGLKLTHRDSPASAGIKGVHHHDVAIP